jgi:hypothetical protein
MVLSTETGNSPQYAFQVIKRSGTNAVKGATPDLR